jgi:DNA-binding IclR family transcriptional regulator
MRSTERIAQVLSLFTSTRPERTTSETAELLGIANSTAHDLLNGLAADGLLSRVAPGRFLLGPRIAQLAATLQASDTLIEASSAILPSLASKYGETCDVLRLVDGSMVSMTASEGKARVRVGRGTIGPETPLHVTAPGKLLMSALSLAELSRQLSGMELLACTPQSVTQKSILRDQIARIREEGYADEVGEFDEDLATTAAPIRNHSGVVVAALCLLVPANRLLRQRRAYRNICLDSARKISERLGWTAGEISQPGNRRNTGTRNSGRNKETKP